MLTAELVETIEVGRPGRLNDVSCDGGSGLEVPPRLEDCVAVGMSVEADSETEAGSEADEVGNVGSIDEVLPTVGNADGDEEVAGEVDSIVVGTNIEELWLLTDGPLGVFCPTGHVSCSTLAGPCVIGLQPGNASSVPSDFSLKTDGCWGQFRAKLTSWLAARDLQALIIPPSSV